jgi:ribonuclease J
MTVFEFDGKLLIVDCGVLFPEEHQPGVDLILPTSSRSVTASTTSWGSC